MNLDDHRDDDWSALWRTLRDEVRKRGADEHLAEDVVQETLLRALERRPERRNLRGWLSVVARNVLWRSGRSERHRLHREARSAREPVELRPHVEAHSTIARWINELPTSSREVVELRYVHDRGISEIAALLGRPEATVRSQLKRGLDRLRARITEDHRGGSRSRFAVLVLGLREFGRQLARMRTWELCGVGACVAMVLVWSVWWLALGRVSDEHVAARTMEVPTSAADVLDRPRDTSLPKRSTVAAESAPRPQENVLAGRVLAPDGSAVTGAAVHAASLEGEARLVARTDAAGRYSFVLGDADQFVWASGSAWTQSRRRAIVAVAARATCDLVLGRSSRLQVQVLTPEREPVLGATVAVEERTADTATYLSTQGDLEFRPPPVAGTTDRSGRVELLAPLDQALTLRVAADGPPSWSGELEPSCGPETVEVVLQRPAGIDGRICDERGAPVWDARIEALQHVDSVRVETRTDVDGSFRIDGLSPGNLTVRAWEETEWMSSLRELQLAEGERTHIELALDRRHTLHGRVTQGPYGGVVRVTPAGLGRRERLTRFAEVQRDGSFVLPGCMPSLEHRLELVLPNSPVLCAVVSDARPEEREYRLTPKTGVFDLRSLVVEVECADPARPATLVELRQTPASIVASVDPITTRATFDGLASFPYLVFVWVPGIGAYKAEPIEVGPGRPKVVHVRVPRTTHVVFELDRAREQEGGEVVGWLQSYGFAALGFGDLGTPTVRIELVPRSDGRFEVDLFPGKHRYHFQNVAGADAWGIVEVGESAEILEKVVIEPYLEVDVVLRVPRPLRGREQFRLETRTARGHVQEVYFGKGSNLRARVPHDAVDLLASSEMGLRGRCELALDPVPLHGVVPRVEIELAEER